MTLTNEQCLIVSEEAVSLLIARKREDKRR
jgi:hypothetical protein